MNENNSFWFKRIYTNDITKYEYYFTTKFMSLKCTSSKVSNARRLANYILGLFCSEFKIQHRTKVRSFFQSCSMT